MAFAQVEPIGPSRGDLQAAIVASTVANTARDAKKHPQPYEPSGFIPDYWNRQRQQSWEEQLRIVELLNVAFGGRDLRPPSPPPKRGRE